MENQALISIIIPVYNVEDYLRECIDSVINQTYKNLEIILVDDGSTDSSGAICDEYAEKDSRIRVIHKENSGPSATRNVGIKNAEGKYIYFLDSDDYLTDNAIELLVNTAEVNDADLVFFDAYSFSDDGSPVKQGYVINGTYETKSGYEILTELCKNKDYHCSIPLLFFRNDFIKNNNLSLVESAYCSEDLLFTYQVYCTAEKVAQCKNTLYHRRYRSNSIVTSKKSLRHFRSCKFVYDAVRDFSEQIGKLNDSTSKDYTVRCALNVFNVYEKLSKADKKVCKKELSDFKKNVLENKAFGNTALKMRCYGKVFWVIYKIYEKTVCRLLKGQK